jgi:large subunit ribosomal protein L46
LIRDAQVEVKEGEENAVVKKQEVERPYSRVTDADKTGDVKSLDRLLQRTLYLLVKTENDKRWGFPSSFMEGKESLHMVRSPKPPLGF